MIDVEFRLKEGESTDRLKAACGEFWNNLLDQEIRQKVLIETEGIRDTLIKKAFFDARAPLPESIISDEKHCIQNGQGNQKDPNLVSRQD